MENKNLNLEEISLLQMFRQLNRVEQALICKLVENLLTRQDEPEREK